MNERIRELAAQATKFIDPIDPQDHYEIFDKEKFAELVAVAEREACARVCETFINGSAGLVDNTAQVCAEAIRARGVEE